MKATEACKDIATARRFVAEVGKLAKKYDANYFIVTDGASGTSNNGNPAVRNARNAQIEWEKKHGFDPDEDWSKSTESSEVNMVDEELIVLESMQSAYDFIAEEGLLSKIKDKVASKKAATATKKSTAREISYEEFMQEYYPKYKACARDIIAAIKKLKHDKQALPWAKVVSITSGGEWHDDSVPFVYIYDHYIDDPDQKLTSEEEELCYNEWEESGRKYFDNIIESIAEKHNMELGGTSYSACISTKDDIKVVGKTGSFKAI